MATLMIEIPEEVVDVLRVPEGEALARMRLELALRLYEKELLSFGKARELAHMDYWNFSELLAREGILRHYDAKELADDLATLERLA